MISTELWIRSCLGKKKYQTAEFAQKLADRIKNDPTRSTQLYVYSCQSCQGFHLTKRKPYTKEQVVEKS